jgi:AcrR family transcriptional regulator
MATKTLDRASARERLLAAADELFYEEGVHSVGIDRVIERAGVAKATLYNAFGSKDELIRAYLGVRHQRTKERLVRGLERYDTPRDKLVGLFEVQGDWLGRPGFRGCAFVAASAEARPGSPIEEASDEFRSWVRTLIADLARQAGAADPEGLARQLVIIYDGASIGGRMDHDADTASFSRATAQAVVDAALGAAS